MIVEETYPHQYARTRRFTCGEPRSFTVANGCMFFLRSASGDDPVNQLWTIQLPTDANRQVLGPEQLLADPAVVLQGHDEHDLPAAERARRERLRETAGGITAYSIDRAATKVVFILAGRLVVVSTGSASFDSFEVAAGGYEAQISPDGRRVAYLADGALRVIDIGEPASAERDRVIAHEYDPDITWGAADFTASEEFDRFRGYWWSPDSNHILAVRVDNTPVQTWWISDPAHPEQTPTSHRYPAAGTANADLSVAIWNIASDDPTSREVDIGLDAEYPYLLHADWTELGIVLVTLDRSQNHQCTYRLLDLDDAPVLANDQYRSVWIELTSGTPRLFDETRLLTTVASGTTDVEPEGTVQLAMVDTVDPQNATPITTSLPNLQIRSVAQATAQHVVFQASASQPITGLNVAVGSEFQMVGELALDTPDAPMIVWAGGSTEPGQHSVAALDGDVMVIRSATVASPGARFRIFANGSELGVVTSFAEQPIVVPSVALLKAGLRQLPVAVYLPTDPALREPGVSLPIVMDPYGGPHAQRVVASYNAHLSSQWLADQGFAVIVVDGRGTPGNGPVFEEALHRDLAGPPLADQIIGLLEAASEFPQCDLTRVGIKGWSFGGYLAALAVLKRPDVFHCAVAGAPVTDWRLYDTAYSERYLGNPSEDDEPYAHSSLIDLASGLSRPLMIIHGLADDNVVAAHSLQLSTALLAAGKPHEFLPLVGVTHMTPQPAVAEHLQMLQLDFLRRHLGSPRV